MGKEETMIMFALGNKSFSGVECILGAAPPVFNVLEYIHQLPNPKV